ESALLARLTQGGLEVEGVERVGPDLSGLRVGLVVSREKHPNADRLSLCRVDLGAGEPAEIVCGAPNVAAGQKVAVASPGATLPDGRKLEKAKIRGVTSHGMICSARELGLGDDAAGILVLDPAAPVGAPLDRVLAAGERVVEIALTPNRGDCASLLGIAREVRAHFAGPLRMPPTEPPEGGAPAPLRVEIADPQGCPRYVGRLVRGVRMGPSPAWLQSRLEAAGMRAINVVVDVTNLVLLELGQPLHAFDAAQLRGGVVRVRRAAAGEKLATLDGECRALEAEDLVIADGERAIALAGVMGGAETEVGERTRDVFLESAQFDPTRVRRTVRRLGLHSEASYRFERQVDREGVRRACDRAARLLAELAGGEPAPGALEALGAPLEPLPVLELSPERANRLLGTALSREEIVALLARVEVAVETADATPLRFRMPSWRNDLRRPVDLVEEIARIHGYDRIPTTMPRQRLAPVEESHARTVAAAARDALRAAGLLECMTLPFVSAAALDDVGLPAGDPRRRLVRVTNPLTEEEGALRTTLVPSILGVVRSNRSRQVERVRVFELGRTFHPRADAPGTELPRERSQLVAAIAGGPDGLWEQGPPVPVFFELKGAAEQVLDALGLAARFTTGTSEPWWHPAASAAIEVGGAPAGGLGELHPDVAARLGIEGPCAVLVLDLDALTAAAPAPRRFVEPSRHPHVRRDLAVLLPRDAAAARVLEAIRATAGPHLVDADIFDRYEGRGVPEGRVSVAFRLVFQRPDRTLTDAEVARAVERVVGMLADRFGGELRQGGDSRGG
ncbi:MAG TPA: phenylalanine--tRNA ligase subunit beta, partial [Myxococcota bacterium]|nr:phenylalanine--tRNA ligase subunit beta [Myxococcota bacterium]